MEDWQIDRIDDSVPMEDLPSWLQELWEIEPYIARRAEKHYFELIGHEVKPREIYEYEMRITDMGTPFEINTWLPITIDRIKDLSRIDEYIQKGLLRRIENNDQ